MGHPIPWRDAKGVVHPPDLSLPAPPTAIPEPGNSSGRPSGAVDVPPRAAPEGGPHGDKEKRIPKKKAKRKEVASVKKAPTDEFDYEQEEGIFVRHVEEIDVGGKIEKDITLEQICNFKVTWLGILIEDNGIEQTRFFQVWARMEGQDYGPFKLPAKEFYFVGRWASEFLGPRARIEPKQGNPARVLAAIQRFAKTTADRIIRTATGWYRIDGEWRFLHAAGAIDKNGLNDRFKAELPPNLQQFKLPAPPTDQRLKLVVEESLGLLNTGPDRITVPVWAAVVRAPLGNARESVFVNGYSGEGKTTIAVLIQQFFGMEFREDLLPESWQSTTLAIQETLYSAKDVLVVVDDYTPPPTPQGIKEYGGKADLVFRGVANSAGRGRLNPDGSKQAPHPPRASVLSTGEVLPSGTSCVARFVSVPIVRGSIDFAKLDAYQRRGEEGVYAEAMAAYIQWLAPQYDTIRNELPVKTREFQSKINVEHRRNSKNLASLAVGIDTYLTFAEEIEAINSEEHDKVWKRAWGRLLGLTGEQTELQHAEDTALEVLKLWKSAEELGKISLLDGLDTQKPDGLTNCVGWRDDDGTWYLDPQAGYAAIVKLFREQNRMLAWKKHELWNRLYEKKLILKEKPDRYQVQRTINGKSKWVIAIPPEAFDKVDKD